MCRCPQLSETGPHIMQQIGSFDTLYEGLLEIRGSGLR